MTQTRTCTNPAPSNGGADCDTNPIGATNTGVTCNSGDCPSNSTDCKVTILEILFSAFLAFSCEDTPYYPPTALGKKFYYEVSINTVCKAHKSLNDRRNIKIINIS